MTLNFGIVGNDAVIIWSMESLSNQGTTPMDLSDAQELVVTLGYGMTPDVVMDASCISLASEDHSTLKIRIPGNHPKFQRTGWVNAVISFAKEVEGVVHYYRATRSKCIQYYANTEQVEALIAKGAEFNGNAATVKRSDLFGNITIEVYKTSIVLEGDGDNVDRKATTIEGLTDSDDKFPTSGAVKQQLDKLEDKIKQGSIAKVVVNLNADAIGIYSILHDSPANSVFIGKIGDSTYDLSVSHIDDAYLLKYETGNTIEYVSVTPSTKEASYIELLTQ
ncbi:MAG: hypothetical protein IKO36_04715 [Bacteroidaceae bacterium]|nr:hypothetical protein [Bacteroidaceae bacterium]